MRTTERIHSCQRIMLYLSVSKQVDDVTTRVKHRCCNVESSSIQQVKMERISGLHEKSHVQGFELKVDDRLSGF